MGLAIVQVDAFTDTPFRGNPAAVCVLPAPRDASWMQAVAREMNLSATAFLHPADDGFAGSAPYICRICFGSRLMSTSSGALACMR